MMENLMRAVKKEASNQLHYFGRLRLFLTFT